MDPWHRFRLLACIVMMLGIVCAGALGLLVPCTAPYGVGTGTDLDGREWEWTRETNPVADGAFHFFPRHGAPGIEARRCEEDGRGDRDAGSEMAAGRAEHDRDFPSRCRVRGGWNR